MGRHHDVVLCIGKPHRHFGSDSGHRSKLAGLFDGANAINPEVAAVARQIVVSRDVPTPAIGEHHPNRDDTLGFLIARRCPIADSQAFAGRCSFEGFIQPRDLVSE